MSAPEWHAEAKRLRSEGLVYREIAERLGKPISTVHAAVMDLSRRPGTNARKRAWDRDPANRGRCEDCARIIGLYSTRCHDCTLDRADERREEKWHLIERLWAEGLPATEIATRTGHANSNSLSQAIARMAHAGRPLPPRRPGWKGHANPNPPPLRLPLTRSQVNQRLRYAVRMGRVKRAEACERCGREGRVDGHHHDYSKPLEVEWLCRTCHTAEHGGQRIEQPIEEAA